MVKYAKIFKLGGVLFLGGFTQVLLIWISIACFEDMPADAAVAFTKAYFKQDPAITKRICSTRLAGDGIYAMADMRYHTAVKAKARGFDFNYLTFMAYHIETKTQKLTDSKARVRLTGKARVSVNPVYPYIAILFDIGESHRFDETVTVVKEGNRWKVCEDLNTVFQKI